MKSELILRSDEGTSVIGVARVQEAGRVSVADHMQALGIPREKWRDTWVQIHVILISSEKEE
jgi:hypothetical protein